MPLEEVLTVDRRPQRVADSFVLWPRGSAKARRRKCLIRKTQKLIRRLREYRERRSAEYAKQASLVWPHGLHPMLAY